MSADVSSNYCRMTLHQLHNFIIFNNFLDIPARSLLAAVSFY